MTGLNPNISFVNFHYNTPLDAFLNYGLNVPLADDETGFCGMTVNNNYYYYFIISTFKIGPLDVTYRNQAWRWILRYNIILIKVIIIKNDDIIVEELFLICLIIHLLLVMKMVLHQLVTLLILLLMIIYLFIITLFINRTWTKWRNPCT